MKKSLVLAILAVLGVAGYAIAQTISVPQVAIINSNDLLQVIVHGAPTAGSQYATPSQITSQSGYYKSIPTTLNTFTFGNTTSNAAFAPAGTIAGLYVTAAPNPSDGARECAFTTQTITAFYWAANTSQSINNAVTTLSANTGACYLYSLSNATWDRD